jgi:DNA primase
MWELTIIKTILENPQYLDVVLDVLDISFFKYHNFELDLVLKGELNHPMILDILLDDEIKSLKNFEELKEELIIFLRKYYEIELKKINFQKNISFEQKAFYIRKYRDKISRLKRGELVSYE